VRRARLLLAFAVLAAVAVASLGLRPYRGYSSPEVVVTIPAGANAVDVAERLAQAGVVRSAGWFRWIVRLTGSGAQLQAGEYRFSEPMSLLAVREMLVAGDVLLQRITIPEGLRLAEIVALLAGVGELRSPELAAAAADPSTVRDLDPDATDLEGYLFPDTYQFAAGIPEVEVLDRMVRRFREVVGPEEQARAAELGLTIREVVTLASLVEKETAAPPERPLVSSVFHNRLARGMLLQCDPTVIFGLAREDRFTGRLSRRDLKYDSPYNTYLHPGLPPGPIASPGGEAIRAALYPSDSEFLYFVSMNDGTHHFSRSLREHERAVNQYQRNGRGR